VANLPNCLRSQRNTAGNPRGALTPLANFFWSFGALSFVKRMYLGRSAAGIGRPVGGDGNQTVRASKSGEDNCRGTPKALFPPLPLNFSIAQEQPPSNTGNKLPQPLWEPRTDPLPK